MVAMTSGHSRSEAGCRLWRCVFLIFVLWLCPDPSHVIALKAIAAWTTAMGSNAQAARGGQGEDQCVGARSGTTRPDGKHWTGYVVAVESGVRRDAQANLTNVRGPSRVPWPRAAKDAVWLLAELRGATQR